MERITLRIRVEPEELDYRGNCSATGDEARDREAEDWITHQLARGNIFAWCWISVEVSCGPFTGSDSLGGCSYASREDFERDRLEEMKENALADLRKHMRDALRPDVERIRLAKRLLRNFKHLQIEEEC